MPFTIVAVGNKMANWVNSAFDEYAKRMPREAAISLKEIKPIERNQNKSTADIMALERDKVLAVLPKRAKLVALDEKGAMLSSIKFAALLKAWQQEKEEICFVIGGADGLDPELKARAQFLLSLSPFTLPHGLARVVLAEQLYRAWSIWQHHPYHRV